MPKSPQLENGYTKISNEMIEALCKINLSPYESRVVWFIFRKTYGFNKKADRLALSQIAEGTGLKKPHVCRALKSLTLRAIVTQTGNSHVRFQKDYDFWQHIPRSKVTQTGNFETKPLPKQAPQKKLRTSYRSLEEYLEEVRGEYEGRIDVDEEVKKFHLYYERKPPKNPKLALRNWLNKGVEIRSEVTQTGNGVTQTGNDQKLPMVTDIEIDGELLGAEELWNRCLEILKDKIARSNFDTWLKDTEGLGFKGDSFILKVPSNFVAEGITKRFEPVITKTLSEIADKRMGLICEVGDD